MNIHIIYVYMVKVLADFLTLKAYSDHHIFHIPHGHLIQYLTLTVKNWCLLILDAVGY